MRKTAKGYSPFINLNLTNAGTLDGTIYGSPVINGSYVAPTTSDYAVLNGIQKRPLTEMTMRWKGTVDYTNSGNYAACFGWNNGSASYGYFTGLFRDIASRQILFAIGDGAGNSTRIDTSIELEDDVVYDIVGVWRGGQDVEIYIDGVDVSDTKSNGGSTVTTIPISAMDEFCLHAFKISGGLSYPLIGRTMVAQVFDRAFSAEAVKDLYEQDTIPELDNPLISLPMRSSYVDGDGNRVTENKGTLGGTAQLGDGTTASTFPTQLSPKGALATASQYFNIPSFTQSGTISIAVVISKTIAASNRWITNFGGSASYVLQDASEVIQVLGGGTVYVNGVQTTQASLYKKNVVIVTGIPSDDFTSILFGRDSLSLVGSWHAINVYAGTLTPTQAKLLTNKLIKELNV